jgi:hypothetical protein
MCFINLFQYLQNKRIIKIIEKNNLQLINKNVYLYFSTKSAYNLHTDSHSKEGNILIDCEG